MTSSSGSDFHDQSTSLKMKQLFNRQFDKSLDIILTELQKSDDDVERIQSLAVGGLNLKDGEEMAPLFVSHDELVKKRTGDSSGKIIDLDIEPDFHETKIDSEDIELSEYRKSFIMETPKKKNSIWDETLVQLQTDAARVATLKAAIDSETTHRKGLSMLGQEIQKFLPKNNKFKKIVNGYLRKGNLSKAASDPLPIIAIPSKKIENRQTRSGIFRSFANNVTAILKGKDRAVAVALRDIADDEYYKKFSRNFTKSRPKPLIREMNNEGLSEKMSAAIRNSELAPTDQDILDEYDRSQKLYLPTPLLSASNTKYFPVSYSRVQ